jgi:hypothetical protein
MKKKNGLGILIAGLVLLFLAACVPFPVSAQIDISLGQAIALSRTNSFSAVVVDTTSGTMTMTVAVPGAALSVTEAGGNTV